MKNLFESLFSNTKCLTNINFIGKYNLSINDSINIFETIRNSAPWRDELTQFHYKSFLAKWESEINTINEWNQGGRTELISNGDFWQYVEYHNDIDPAHQKLFGCSIILKLYMINKDEFEEYFDFILEHKLSVQPYNIDSKGYLFKCLEQGKEVMPKLNSIKEKKLVILRKKYFRLTKALIDKTKKNSKIQTSDNTRLPFRTLAYLYLFEDFKKDINKFERTNFFYQIFTDIKGTRKKFAEEVISKNNLYMLKEKLPSDYRYKALENFPFYDGEENRDKYLKSIEMAKNIIDKKVDSSIKARKRANDFLDRFKKTV